MAAECDSAWSGSGGSSAAAAARRRRLLGGGAARRQLGGGGIIIIIIISSISISIIIIIIIIIIISDIAAISCMSIITISHLLGLGLRFPSPMTQYSHEKDRVTLRCSNMAMENGQTRYDCP